MMGKVVLSILIGVMAFGLIGFSNAHAAPGDLIITEIDPTLNTLEIYNPQNVPVDTTGWELRQPFVIISFHPNVVWAPGEYKVIHLTEFGTNTSSDIYLPSTRFDIDPTISDSIKLCDANCFFTEFPDGDELDPNQVDIVIWDSSFFSSAVKELVPGNELVFGNEVIHFLNDSPDRWCDANPGTPGSVNT